MNVSHQSPLADGASYDVIVVGARAAGAATAMLLARQGQRTLLIDQSVFGSDTLSTHALMRGGVLQLSRWGVLGEVISAGTPPVRRTTFHYDDERIVVSIKPSHGVDALYAPRRTVLDPLLVRAAITSGAHVYDRTSVKELIIDHGRVVGVRACTEDYRHVDLTTAMVVGADGIRSTVASATAAPFTRVGHHISAATYGYWSGLATDGYEWYFHPNACCGVIPTNSGQACVFACALPERVGRGGVDVIRDIVAEAAPRLASRLQSAVAPAGARTWSGHHGYLRRSHGPGWALVGDAAYYKDPISAHGLTDALRDAELLATALASAADGGSETDALAGYERERDLQSLRTFEVTSAIAGFGWDLEQLRAMHLALSTEMSLEADALRRLDGVLALS